MFSSLSRALEKRLTIATETHRSQFWRLPMIQSLLPLCFGVVVFLSPFKLAQVESPPSNGAKCLLTLY